MIELRVLGSLQITASDGKPVKRLRSGSRRSALLAYLGAAAVRGPQRRDKLLALFWPESDATRARSALNQALYVIRSELTDASILTRGEDVALNSEEVWCDAVEFERALDTGRAADALALYRGDLLDGLYVDNAPEFEHWLERERGRLRLRASDAAWIAAQSAAADGQIVDAERWARYATDLLPADEAAVRRLMSFLHRHGDRAAALEAYETLTSTLRRELDLQPSAETRDLATAIRGDTRPASPPRTEQIESPTEPATRARPRNALRWNRVPTLAVVSSLVVLGAMVWTAPELGVPKARTNVYAYEFYQRGRQHAAAGFSELNNRLAQEMFERAIEADKDFALAYAGLAQTHALAYWFYYDRSSARIAAAKRAADRAVALKPDLPEAHLALGYYHYWGRLAYEDALAEFRKAHDLGLNSAELFRSVGNVQRRQGKLDDAIASFESAFVRDPGDISNVFNLAQAQALAGQVAPAERLYDRAIALNPNSAPSYWNKAWLYLSSEGNLAKARSALVAPGAPARDSVIQFLVAWIDMVEGRHVEALRRLASSTQAIETQWHFVPNALLRAAIFERQGRPDLAGVEYDSARAILEHHVRMRPDESHLRSAYALALAGVGNTRDAIAEARHAVKLLPVTADAVRGLYRIEDLARVYAKVGMFDAAAAELEQLVGLPGGRSITFLAVDPAWDGLRGMPRFQRLVRPTP